MVRPHAAPSHTDTAPSHTAPLHTDTAPSARPIVPRDHVATFTHTGRVREQNQDRLLSDPEAGLFVVCDGLGGHAAGEVAAQLTVETIARVIEDTPRSANRPLEVGDLRRAIEAANRKVFEQGCEDDACRGMATTVVAALVLPRVPGAKDVTVAVAHTGDSRLSVAHCTPATMPDGRAGTKQQLFTVTEDHEHDGYLTHAVGIDSTVHVTVGVFSVDPGDTLLLYSDGLYRDVSDVDIMRRLCLADVQQAADQLLDAALAGGGRDNVTGIVVRL